MKKRISFKIFGLLLGALLCVQSLFAGSVLDKLKIFTACSVTFSFIKNTSLLATIGGEKVLNKVIHTKNLNPTVRNILNEFISSGFCEIFAYYTNTNDPDTKSVSSLTNILLGLVKTGLREAIMFGISYSSHAQQLKKNHPWFNLAAVTLTRNAIDILSHYVECEARNLKFRFIPTGVSLGWLKE